MDFKKRIHEISQFLQPYQRIWQNEIMLLYPHPLVDYPQEWVEDLVRITSPEDIIRLEKKDVFDLIKSPSLIHFYQKIEELSEVKKFGRLPDFPEKKSSFWHMTPKKQHEIKSLAPFVQYFSSRNQVDKIIDIGGGVGHLAQSLGEHYQLNVYSIDMNSDFQQTGQKRHPSQYVKYIRAKVEEDNHELNSIFTPHSLSLGLHTCGPLANFQIKTSIHHQIKAVINFGCCYDKLHQHSYFQNISQTAKSLEYPIEFNHFALTLATRAHRKMSEKDYQLKLKVKLYRYAIHMLLYDEYQLKEMIHLGNSNPKLYQESFSAYVTEQFKRINLDLKHTSIELNQYFSCPQRQLLLRKMLAAGLIRNAFGRLMELYLLLDRSLYLEENNYSVEIIEFFDESISPRNLAIVASK